MRTQTLDNDTWAAHPGGLRLSREKLKLLQPEVESFSAWVRFLFRCPERLYYKRSFWQVRLEEQLFYGDSRAAVVVSTSPLLVAAYTDELDCVALLRFRKRFVKLYDLQVGTRLLSVNTYEYLEDHPAEDLK